MAKLHGLMDGLVLTSVNESCANAVLEGMASGLPIVATAAGGTSEAVEPGVNGWLVERGPNLVRDLARVLDEWAADAERRARYGRASRRIAVDRFSEERMVRQHIELYEELLDEIRLENRRHAKPGA